MLLQSTVEREALLLRRVHREDLERKRRVSAKVKKITHKYTLCPLARLNDCGPLSKRNIE